MTTEEMFADNPAGVFEALSRATVGIAGAGGIGPTVAVLLARAGAGRLVVADFDDVEARNLNRQSYFLDQVGMPKVQALGQTLARISPLIRYEGFAARLDRELFDDYSALLPSEMMTPAMVRLFRNKSKRK